MVSIVFGSTAKRRMAINAEAPQSTSTPPAGVSSKMHVCSRPPLPNASPLPRNRIRSEEHTSELQSRQYLHSFPTRRSSDLREFRRSDLRGDETEGWCRSYSARRRSAAWRSTPRRRNQPARPRRAFRARCTSAAAHRCQTRRHCPGIEFAPHHIIELVEVLPKGELVPVAGVAHAPALIEPVVLTALDRFLGGPG